MTHGKDATSEAHALQAVEGHHADMLKELNVLVGLLTTAVQAGDAADLLLPARRSCLWQSQ